MLFMLAGYDTTINALAYSFFIPATNLEEQARLREEIDSYFPKDSMITNQQIKTYSISCDSKSKSIKAIKNAFQNQSY